MKKCFLLISMFLAMLAMPVLAQAEAQSGFYLGLQGGLNYKMDRSFLPDFYLYDGYDDEYYYSHTCDTSMDMKWGWAAGVTLGYGFGGARDWVVKPRAELELTWRRNSVNSIVEDWDDEPVHEYTDYLPARFTSMATMANLLFDFDLGGRVYPYVGFGLGAVTGWLSFDDEYQNDGLHIKDTVFAYQAKAGVGFIVNDVISLFAEYTYIGSMDFVQDTFFADEYIGVGSRTFEGMSDHSIMLGIRFAFGKPQPAPVVVPAVVAPVVAPEPVLINSFRVFFDHDSSRIDSAASAVIAQAVAEFNRVGVLRIDVTGHADTTGSAAYNLALSERRAEAVTSALVASGVPRSAISIFAAGEYDLLVPTGDNVRERQNRNVYIYLYK